MARTRLTIPNPVAANDFEAALDRHLGLGITGPGPRDPARGHRTSESTRPHDGGTSHA